MAVVAIIAQGMMGAGIGRRLHESGAEVRTLLRGRSGASAERAAAAGMRPAADERALLAGADCFLSILPPGEAEPLARQLAPAFAGLDAKPTYVDCNAVSPQTAIRIGAIVTATGARFVDAGIIGGPPRPGRRVRRSTPPAPRSARRCRCATAGSICAPSMARSGPPRASRCRMPGSPRERPRSPRRCCWGRRASAAARP